MLDMERRWLEEETTLVRHDRRMTDLCCFVPPERAVSRRFPCKTQGRAGTADPVQQRVSIQAERREAETKAETETETGRRDKRR